MKNNERYLDSLAPLIKKELTPDCKTFLMTASDDQGVIKNQGRSGARYAPEAIINVLKKMTNQLNTGLPIYESEVFESTENSFEQQQLKSAQKIYSLMDKHLDKNFIHLGGGHDHAYPLLKAVEQIDKIENILIINIDAHCDTRIDDQHHSGTPFRNFTDETNKNVHLIQYGIHHFANSPNTMTPIKNGSEKHYSLAKVNDISKNFTRLDKSLFKNLPFSLGDKTFIYFSLDCDAISSAIMEAVSAVNHDGLPLQHIHLLINKVQCLSGPKALGIYEYNPIYDNLSQKGARGICSLIYNWLSH